jgi:acyl carrier protein
MDDAIFQKLRDLMVEHLDRDPETLRPASSLIEPNDSFEDVILIMAVEEAFDVHIPDADAEKLRTVADLATWLEHALYSERRLPRRQLPIPAEPPSPPVESLPIPKK